MEQLQIRPAAAGDLAAINAIYNHYVIHSTTTYQTDPETAEGRQAWFSARGPAHPVTVAEAGGEVLGWAALSPFRSKAAYRHTVENSVYVRHDARGKGVGGALLSDLVRRAGELGHHSVVAVIDADQAASIALHSRWGFVEVARLREVGFKFGRWLDVVYMQRMG
ncbi:MAG: GNAT family N-acetyltransferase [Thermoguttaceae bacterium]